MYIEPNTTIKLYSGIPLDNTYEHTLYFASLSAQNAYFHGGIAKYTLANNSYQRVERGKMRIEKKADDLYDCNYLAFQNVNYGNKWFYAFITGVEYINNITSEITFEIDSMQTYLFEVELKNCFVVREHSLTDEIGDNIQAEPVEVGEYVISDYNIVKYLTDMCVIIAIVIDNASNIGNRFDGIYSGVDLYVFNANDTGNISAFLNSYLQRPEQIVSMYMCPRACITDVPSDIPAGGKKLDPTSNGVKYYVSLPSVTQATQDFEGYVPKNKKMYTYPYNYVRVDNAKGESLNLRYEFFDALTPVVEITCTVQMPVQMVLRPCSYKGLPSYTALGGYTASKSECISLDNYPMCSWNVDSYKSWVSQKALPLLISSVSRGVTGVSRLNTSGTGSLVSGVASIITEQYEASIKADVCRGNISDGNVNVSNGYQNFYNQRCHVTRDYAEVIDNFFTMFGYATNKVKTPNISSRPHWNYIQTKGCIIVGSAPSDEIRRICSIYDKGITFWKYASEVGDYTLDNSPT